MRKHSLVGAGLWHTKALAEEVTVALNTGGRFADGVTVDGRAIAVKASPLLGNATNLAIGTAALPAGYSSPAHTHQAEEVALIVSGSGIVEIAGRPHRVEAGSLLLTPANAPHTTHADAGSEGLVIIWIYAPAGSEARWLPSPEPTVPPGRQPKESS